MKIAVFASGNGTDLQAIIDGCQAGLINAEVGVVISNNQEAYALVRAKANGIPHYHLDSKDFINQADFDNELIKVLENHQIDLIFLAGYLKKISHKLIETYLIYNIHPALLPKYGGKGMYGINIHQAVIAAGEAMTGITIHQVSAEYDRGQIIAQTEVPVQADDTPETLQGRVLEREHTFIVEILSKIVDTLN